MRADFGELLDDLLAEDAVRSEGAARSAPSVDYLAVAEELHSGRIRISPDAAAAEYRESSGSATVAAPQLAPELPVLDTKPEAVARELGLLRTRSGRDLDALRRAFARENHPDRVPAELRQSAMLRMQIANRLIDEAKRANA